MVEETPGCNSKLVPIDGSIEGPVGWQMHGIRTFCRQEPGIVTDKHRVRLAPKLLSWRNRQGEAN
jgi:hypothetical protein